MSKQKRLTRNQRIAIAAIVVPALVGIGGYFVKHSKESRTAKTSSTTVNQQGSGNVASMQQATGPGATAQQAGSCSANVSGNGNQTSVNCTPAVTSALAKGTR